MAPLCLLQKKTDIVLQACVARVMRLRRCSGRIFCIELFLPKCQSVDYRWRSLLSVVKFENSGSICLTSLVGDSNFEMKPNGKIRPADDSFTIVRW